MFRITRCLPSVALVMLSAVACTDATTAPAPLEERTPDEAAHAASIAVATAADMGTSTSQFLETFDGQPSAPLLWQKAQWDISLHATDFFGFEPQHADHGAGCDAPPATHLVRDMSESVFQCRDHLMTAMNTEGYGVAYLTPNQMVDFSGTEAVVSFDVSTLRRSGRDWINVWVSPYDDHLQMPVERDAPDLGGPPRNGIHVELMPVHGDDFRSYTDFNVFVFRDGVRTKLARLTSRGYASVVTPSATQRERFELRISQNRIRFGMPARNLWWVDRAIAPLSWQRGVVQLSHVAYSPTKDCRTCTPNTWHWDNVLVAPAVPFTMLAATPRTVKSNSTVQFERPAPAGSHLRFAGFGNTFQLSFDGGATWTPATLARQRVRKDNFLSYWTPVPEGVTSVRIKGTPRNGNPWLARDISIWSQQ